MRLLLDTQSLILVGQGRLPARAKEVYSDKDNEVYFSLVSLWEIGIKTAVGKLRFKRNLKDYHDLLVEELNLAPLSIEATHIERAVRLPFHHRDPFDRLIIGQSLTERLCVLSGDVQFDAYKCDRIWD
ncbi:MAG: type II toxin-antitoxin system VapC family toxin [Deltaproteobacteria bacterium]|nr:type II toxin-antitoxin system VapC family toxin [Deltaproteobacteria bacterium]MBI3294517.1 type II toxin-antitoxin system VapC family toxin [Deltaproteobacteria bacterium]